MYLSLSPSTSLLSSPAFQTDFTFKLFTIKALTSFHIQACVCCFFPLPSSWSINSLLRLAFLWGLLGSPSIPCKNPFHPENSFTANSPFCSNRDSMELGNVMAKMLAIVTPKSCSTTLQHQEKKALQFKKKTTTKKDDYRPAPCLQPFH